MQMTQWLEAKIQAREHLKLVNLYCAIPVLQDLHWREGDLCAIVFQSCYIANMEAEANQR